MTLVEELLGVNTAPGVRGIPAFEACIASSNGMLIPPDLIVQVSLAECAGREQARLLREEFTHKSRLIDRDRRIAACMCDILPRALQANAALAECLAALAPSAVPRALLLPVQAAGGVAQVLPADDAPLELLVLIDLALPTATVLHELDALVLACQARRETRIVAVPRLQGAQAPAVAEGLLPSLLQRATLLFLLPLLQPGAGTARASPAPYEEWARGARVAGWQRVAPGLYAVPPLAPRPWLSRLLGHLPQSDVLGLGPAAWSRFDDVRFDNHATLRDYARDIGRGGFAIAHAHNRLPQEQLVEALLLGLASGASVDLRALAVQCRCASPSMLAACDALGARLLAQGALSGSAAGLLLEAANDAHYAEVCSAAADLRTAAPGVTAMASRRRAER